MWISKPFAAGALVCLVACGGGGGYGGNTPPPINGMPPPSNLHYSAALAVYTVGTAIAPLVPSYSGTVTSFSVTPALPAGLSLDAASGLISGTPTAAAAARVYTVSAANSGGSTTATLTLTVNPPAPQVSYGSNSLLFTTGHVSRVVPTNTGGAVSSWSINPALPAGLTFNGSDGSIAGTASAPLAPTPYTVTAANSGGVDNVTVTLNVAKLLLDLGHGTGIGQVVVTPTRVLSVDGNNHWVLWDYATAARLASGDVALCNPGLCPQAPAPPYPVADMAGSTFAVQVNGGVELRSAVDGALLATVNIPPQTWRLASDGSYLCSASSTGISAWTLNGSPTLNRAGNYGSARIFCAPAEMRVAVGPAGAHQIETISLPAGTSSQGPAFTGTFYAWFEDGGRFLTTASYTVWVYSKDGSVQLDARVLPAFIDLAGEGNWFWTLTSVTLNIYAVGASATPAATVETSCCGELWAGAAIAAPSGLTKGLLHVVDLSGASPVVTDYSFPPLITAPGALGAVSSTQWVLGADAGIVVDGTSLKSTPRYFGYGAPLSVAGGTTQFAVATAIGQTLIYDATSWALEGSLQSPINSLAMSADGSVLAALGFDGTNYFVRTYALPATSLLHGWTYPVSAPFPQPVYVTLSADGTTLAQVLQTAGTPTFQGEVDNAAGGTVLWSGPVPTSTYSAWSASYWQPIRLSPDGTSWTTSGARDSTGTTTLYHGGAQVTVIPGWAQAWLSNDKLLQIDYTSGHAIYLQSYLGAQLFNASGASLGVAPLPAAFAQYPDVQVLGADSLYQPGSNSIWTVSTGTQSWVGPAPLPLTQAYGAVAGNEVVFLLNSELLMQPH
jgi:hypothetical protein